MRDEPLAICNDESVTLRSFFGKQNLMYLRGLEQNKELEAPTSITETYEKQKISVKLKTRDFFTFIRLEHEAQELQRRQNDFIQQRQQHMQLKSGDTIMENELRKKQELKEFQKKKFNNSWIVGISLAKRFLKRAQAKKVSRIATNFVRTSLKNTTSPIKPARTITSSPTRDDNQ
jgi:hypothetical protein